MYHNINPVIDARFVPVLPMDWFGFIRMRMELYSCQSKLLAGLLCFTLRNDQHKTSPFNINKNTIQLGEMRDNSARTRRVLSAYAGFTCFL